MSRIDLDTLIDEASEDAHTITFKGEDFTVQPLEQWDLKAVDAMNEGRIRDALELALGDQWEAFSALSPSLMTLRVMFDAMTESQGLGDGPNSSGSSGSSKSITKKSKRPSKPTTKSNSVISGEKADA